jgi:ketosteroid isomerase-like protein
LTNIDVVLRFIDAINHHAVADIVARMADDHLFIDSLGAEHRGRATMEKGWSTYLGMVPDYAIAVGQVIADGSTVVILGTASGTYAPDGTLRPDDCWSTPAAWRAVVSADRIAVWQVFADNEPIRRAARRRGADIG